MRYAKILNGAIAAYPYGGVQFQADNPYTNYGPTAPDILATFPLTDLAKQGYSAVEVVLTAQPTFDPVTQSCTEGVPSLVSGVWTQTWVIATLSAATQAVNLANAQAARITALASSYVAAIALPVSYTSVAGVIKTYQADPQSTQNLQSSIAGCTKYAATPAGFYWVAADNAHVPFAYADLQGLAEVIFAQGAVAFQHLQSLKAQVLATTTSAAIQAVVW